MTEIAEIRAPNSGVEHDMVVTLSCCARNQCVVAEWESLLGQPEKSHVSSMLIRHSIVVGYQSKDDGNSRKKERRFVGRRVEVNS